MAKFTVGDIVYHKSNARQKMVIINVREYCRCRWVGDEGEVYLQDFFEDELEKRDDLIDLLLKDKK